MTDQREERNIGTLQHIADVCREQGVDSTPVMHQAEQVVKALRSLREDAEKAGLNSRERRIVGEAVADAVREGMK